MRSENDGGSLWSFSRLETYNSCPYAWYKHYVLEEDGDASFYSQNGTDVHQVLDLINKGDVALDDAAAEYLHRADYNDWPVRDSVRDSTIEKCASFFTDYDFWWLNDGYDVVASEKELFFEIGGHRFHGFIDLLLRSNQTGKLVIVDYKSSDWPLKKNGEPMKNAEARFRSQKRQEYLYAEAVKQNFGETPIALSWLFFKEQKYLAIPLKDDEWEEAKEWALSTIAKIEADTAFAENRGDYMMCNVLCEYRNACEYKELDDDE